MVILLTGDNAYQAAEEIRRLEQTLRVASERVDADILDAARLADIMKGASLFAETRLVVIDELSAKTDLWNLAADWVENVDDTVTLVLREPKPDKRTKAYKIFAKVATVIDVVSWTERQRGLAEKWLNGSARERGVTLTPQLVQAMVARALLPSAKQGQRVVDQGLLLRALEAMASAGEVTEDTIATVMPESTSDAVFELLEIAVRGDAGAIQEQITSLRLTQEGYQLFALVLAQWSQLVMVALARGEDVAGVHPYVQQKLRSLVTKLTTVQLRDLTQLAASLDIQSKSTGLDPWDATMRLLLGVAQRSK